MTRPDQRPASNSEARKREQRKAFIPAHLTIDEPAGKIDCTVCHEGISAPPSFGGIPRADMLASFIVLHLVHTRAGRAAGLTAAGNPTKAARDVLGSRS